MKLYYKTLAQGNKECPLLSANCSVCIVHQEHPKSADEAMMGAVHDMLREPNARWLLIVNATEPGMKYYFAATTDEHVGEDSDAMYAYTESVGKCIFGNDFALDALREPSIGEIALPELIEIAGGKFVHCRNDGAILRLEKVHSAPSRVLKYVVGGRWFYNDVHVASILWRGEDSSITVFTETNYATLAEKLLHWIGEHLDLDTWYYADVSNCLTLQSYAELCKPRL